MDGTFQTLTIDEIVHINHSMIDRFGGTFIDGDRNMLYPGSLENILESVQGSLYGQELYPGHIRKAAVIGWRIIQGHIFHDGNKRTGLESCRMILEMNGYNLSLDQEAIDIVLRIALGEVDQDTFIDWVANQVISNREQL